MLTARRNVRIRFFTLSSLLKFKKYFVEVIVPLVAMEEIIIKDKAFVRLLTEDQIQSRIDILAREMTDRLDAETVVFIVILKGSLFVSSDLIRSFGGACSMEVIRARSYVGMKSSGVVEITMTETMDLEGKTLVIVEDIVETGKTLQAVHHHLRQRSPKEILTFSLLRKPSAQMNPISIDFVGFDIPQAFVVGYGLDYDEEARHLRDIYQLKE